MPLEGVSWPKQVVCSKFTVSFVFLQLDSMPKNLFDISTHVLKRLLSNKYLKENCQISSTNPFSLGLALPDKLCSIYPVKRQRQTHSEPFSCPLNHTTPMRICQFLLHTTIFDRSCRSSQRPSCLRHCSIPSMIFLFLLLLPSKLISRQKS